MKKRWIGICLAAAALLCSTYVLGASGEDISGKFPDPAFRQAVERRVGKPITAKACAGVRELDVSERGITSLEGISYFVNLKELDVSENALTSLDVSALAKLEELECDDNLLTGLDLRKNTRLKELECQKNLMKSEDAILTDHAIRKLRFSPQKGEEASPGQGQQEQQGNGTLSVQLTVTEAVLYKDAAAAYRKVNLGAAVTGGEGTLCYRSSNKKVASVNARGTVTAKKKGSCVITAYLKENPQVQAVCAVTVKNPTLTVSAKELTLRVGEKHTLTGTSFPAAKLTFESERKKVAKVSKKGVVTALSPGLAVIEVEANDVEKKVRVQVIP